MSRFKVGQEAICINEGGWFYEKEIISIFGIRITRKVPVEGPKKDELVTVVGHNRNNGILLSGYSPIVNGERGAYLETCFEPVVPSEIIEELMNSLQEQL